MSALSLQAFGAAFLASLVECVEALTVVLAVGAVRGWNAALAGAGAALALLTLLAAAAGPLLLRVPIALLHLVIGLLLLAFGLRWLRKAVLRAAGRIALRDEDASYQRTASRFGQVGVAVRLDRVAFGAAFNIVMIEGIEVIFIVIAVGAAGGLLGPASAGAAAALLLVVAAGAALHRLLALVPENSLKFAASLLLCGFGTFWLGEAAGVAWPGGDAILLPIVACWAAGAGLAVWLARRRAA